METILLIGGLAVLAVLGVEYGLYRRAKRRDHEHMFDQGLPFIEGHHPGEDRIGDQGAMDHIDPSDHPGV
jgi:hypothetical protein